MIIYNHSMKQNIEIFNFSQPSSVMISRRTRVAQLDQVWRLEIDSHKGSMVRFGSRGLAYHTTQLHVAQFRDSTMK
jgi:hypothetical protein